MKIKCGKCGAVIARQSNGKIFIFDKGLVKIDVEKDEFSIRCKRCGTFNTFNLKRLNFEDFEIFT